MKTSKNNTSPYTDYANSVVSGGIVAGRFVRLACQRYLDWMERDDIIFVPEKADKVIRFAEKLHHYKDYSGPFILEPWQKFVVYHIYGFYYADRPDKRVVRNVLLLCSRKQGKSHLISILGLFSLLCDDVPSPEVYVLANSAKQAGNLFEMAKTFAHQLDPTDKHIRPYRDSLKVPQNNGILRTLANNLKAADGFNSSLTITDEFAAATDNALHSVLKSSQTSRKNPLDIIISTAGHSMLSPCYEMRQACIDILAGIKQDDRQVAFIYELDEGDKWDDPEVWAKSNPNLGVSVQKEEIAAAVLEAKNGTSDMAEVKTKTINIWLNSANQWLDQNAVQKRVANVDLNDHRGEFAYFGVDLATTNDLTAMSVMFPYEEDKSKVFKTWYFMPQTSLSNGHNASLYQRWNREGLLIITPGDATDFDFVRDKMIHIIEDYELTAVGIYYDRLLAHGFATSCNEMGLQAIPFAQSYVNYTSPILDFERGIVNGTITIDSNIITRWCLENSAIKTTSNLCMVVRKGTKYEKIDGTVAMLMAMGGFEQTKYKGLNYRK